MTSIVPKRAVDELGLQEGYSKRLNEGCVHGPDGTCGRKRVVRDMCMSHYRMWRAGKPLTTAVRSYTRYTEGPDGKPQKLVAVRPRTRRDPFEKERALISRLRRS